MGDWKLKDCYLISDMERLDSPQLFQLNFECEDLDEFLTQIREPTDVFRNKRNINFFFERLLDFKEKDKMLYLRFKWVVYLHSLIRKFNHENQLFKYIHKALHMYLQRLPRMQERMGTYESYLTNRLFRPYLQYLNKLCALQIRQFEQNNQQKEQDVDIMAWYKGFNFVVWANSALNQPLEETKRFFSVQFPYLNKMSWLIHSDLNRIIGCLRQHYRTMNGSLNVTIIELDQLTHQINSLSDPEDSFTFKTGMRDSLIEDLSKQDITEFFRSPQRHKPEHMTDASSLNTQSPDID